jgi:hypothetical protein
MLSVRWFCLASAFLASGLVVVARADTVRVAGQDLSLPPPTGHCFLDRTKPFDAFVMDAVEQPQRDQVKILLHFVPCDEIDAWRNGTGEATLYGDIGAIKIQGLVRPVPFSRSEYLTQVAKEMPKVDVDAVEAQFNAKSEDIKVAATDFVAVLAQDGNAVYTGVLGGATLAANSDVQSKKKASVVAMTLLRSIPFTIDMTVDATPGALDGVLEELKPYVNELVRLNP